MAKNEDKVSIPLSRRIFSPWYHDTLFRYILMILLILTIVFLFYQVAFLLSPVLDFISILFAPIAISFVFYYLFRPTVRLLEKWGCPRSVAIIFMYLIGIILVLILLSYLGPILSEQIKALANTSIDILERYQQTTQGINILGININLEYELRQRLIALMQGAISSFSKGLVDLLSIVTRVATVLAVIPFIVYYLLKEDENFLARFLNWVPSDFGREAAKILKNIDETLSNYINGLAVVGVSVGSMLFVGYLIIGINYALILAVIAIILTSIPYLGPFMAFAPALIVGLSDSLWMALKVSIIFVIVQQAESTFISPQVIGQRLHIHPLTIILLLLAAGTLYGLIGLLLATPAYAMAKVLIENLYKIYRLRYPKIKPKK